MLVKNGKMMLNIHGRHILPGETADLPDATAKKLLSVGLVSAMTEPPENAMMPRAKPRHVGGGMYELPGGKRIRGKKAAEQALRE